MGEAGERLAARFVRAAGLRCLGRRVATARGEVDLVALDAGRLVCIEVKTALGARNRHWRPGERLRRKAFERQQAAARALAAQGLGGAGAARLDLIEVWIGPPRSAPVFMHHRGLHAPLERLG